MFGGGNVEKMKRFTRMIVLSLVLMLTGGIFAPAVTALAEETTYPVTIKHESGETVIEKEPERIVVLDIAALDTIDKVGAGDKVVGTITDRLPDSLAKYRDLESVGSPKEPDMEAIARLEPDLVFIGNRLADMYSDFSEHWTTINSAVSWRGIPEGETYSEKVPENVLMVATAVGKKKEGEAARQELIDLMAKYKDLGKDKGKALVLMSNGGEISMHGPASRFALIFDVFGFENVDYEGEDEGHKGQKISFETVQEINPDWIFVLDRDAAVGKAETGDTAQSVMDNDLVKSTNAAKEGHIVYLSPTEWYIVMTGANNYETMLNEVAEAIK